MLDHGHHPFFSPAPSYCQASGYLGSLVLASVPGETRARKIRKSETCAVRCQGVEVVVGRNAGHLRETARDEGEGAVVGFDEDEPPGAPVGGVLLQESPGGRAAPGEGVEDQRVGTGGGSQYAP